MSFFVQNSTKKRALTVTLPVDINQLAYKGLPPFGINLYLPILRPYWAHTMPKANAGLGSVFIAELLVKDVKSLIRLVTGGQINGQIKDLT